MALFIGGGVWAFINLPVEAFPDVTDTQVTVISLYPGRAAEEVEKQVTVPLEVSLSGLPGERHFQRYGHLLLDHLGGAPGVERDHRDLRVGDVGEGLDRKV